MIVESREFSFRIDRDGVVSDVAYANPSPPIVLLGGTVHGGPDIYTMSMDTVAAGTQEFVFLLDPDGRHAAFASMGLSPTVAIMMFGALERGASSRPIYAEGDVWGGWSGYGYAYDPPSLGFAPLSPVTATASDASPSDIFEVTLPGGSFQGVREYAATDKQFVGVMALPASGATPSDFSYYALNRD